MVVPFRIADYGQQSRHVNSATSHRGPVVRKNHVIIMSDGSWIAAGLTDTIEYSSTDFSCLVSIEIRGELEIDISHIVDCSTIEGCIGQEFYRVVCEPDIIHVVKYWGRDNMSTALHK